MEKVEQIVEFEELELLPSEMTLTDAMKLAWAIKHARAWEKDLQEQQQAAMQIYAEKREKARKQREFLEAKLAAWMSENKRKFILPTGETVSISRRKEIVYPKEPKELARELGFIRIKEEPDLKALREAAKSGKIDGVEFEVKESVQIRKPKQSKEESWEL